MEVRTWFAASLGYALLVGGCGGSARDIARAGAGNANSSLGGQNAVGSGGSGNAGSGAAEAGNSTTAPAQGGSAGEASTCVGLFDEVAENCPLTLCGAMDWAQTCNTLEGGGAIADIGRCAGLSAITLDFGTHGTACYYASGSGDPRLVGAAKWDDVPHYCHGTAFRIETGSTTTSACGTRPLDSKIICDASGAAADDGGDAGAGGGEAAPKAGSCFNALSNSCEPCCPAVECTGKPNGYPGYRCTPSANSFCSCTCSSEAWSCAC